MTLAYVGAGSLNSFLTTSYPGRPSRFGHFPQKLRMFNSALVVAEVITVLEKKSTLYHNLSYL